MIDIRLRDHIIYMQQKHIIHYKSLYSTIPPYFFLIPFVNRGNNDDDWRWIKSDLNGVIIDEVVGVCARDAVHVGDLVPELDSVELAGVVEQLRPEKGHFKVNLKLILSH